MTMKSARTLQLGWEKLVTFARMHPVWKSKQYYLKTKLYNNNFKYIVCWTVLKSNTDKYVETGCLSQQLSEENMQHILANKNDK